MVSFKELVSSFMTPPYKYTPFLQSLFLTFNLFQSLFARMLKKQILELGAVPMIVSILLC